MGQTEGGRGASAERPTRAVAETRESLAGVLAFGSLGFSLFLWAVAWVLWDRRGGSSRTVVISASLEFVVFAAAFAGAALSTRRRLLGLAAVALSAGVLGSGVFALATVWRYGF